MTYLLLSICIAIVTIHTFYYVFAFNFLNFHKTKTINNTTPVSVIVCAKNEAKNLKKLLPLLIKQQYVNFEIVLINDRSSDETETIFKAYEAKYDFIKIVTVKEVEHFYGNKKYALTLGIKAAKNDCLLFTDADCVPKSNLWIQEMSNLFESETTIVLGYSPYSIAPYNFLNKLIRYETLITAVQYFSFAKIGIPYMGVGRNLLYSKKLFLKNKGFYQHINIMSGDDDLLINRISNRNNTKICISENTHMVSEPKTSLKTLITQKRRHISTAQYYKLKHKIILGIYAINRTIFWVIFPISLMLISDLKIKTIIAILIGFKFLSEYIVLGISALKLKEKGIIPWIIFLDLLLLLFQLFIYVYNSFHKPKRWS